MTVLPIAASTAAAESRAILTRLGVSSAVWSSDGFEARSPIDGSIAGRVAETPDLEAVAARSLAAFQQWKRLPAPRRGELVRLLGEELRASKDDLARLVTLEAGKIVSEGLGEVQEMIDICDFAVGLSR
ncbi:MAG: aldehyde dehydrogenase family protein, partial [Brevundimonas sp.]